MSKVQDTAKELGFDYGHMTMGQCVEAARRTDMSVGEVVIAEAMDTLGLSRASVYQSMKDSFRHNLRAAKIGVESGGSFLLGTLGQDLTKGGGRVVADEFVNAVVTYTLAAQVGNHSIGLQPCAGTGDSCPYTGFVKALYEYYDDEGLVARTTAVILKTGGIFRVGKTTTGCNMEGIGAGAAALAAAFVELRGGTPEQLERAMVLAISPTIGVPCTPRVLVPGLCATHIGGGVLIARLASQLALETSIPSVVPVDVMIAMAQKCHLASAKHVVPVTIEYMEAFFKRDGRVDAYADENVLLAESERRQEVIERAQKETAALSGAANPIVRPFGDAVVGGSSQGVGSPTNCARIANALSRGKIKKVKIELYSELFARRAINVPGILMGAVMGSSTDDADMYANILDIVKRDGVEVEILEVKEPSLQRVSIEASEQSSMVESLNRGGARLVLLDAKPSVEAARTAAERLNIVVVD